MARCGRCGLWNQYPENHSEKKHAGVCMWYQIRLHDTDVWEPRDCSDFFERIPGLHPFDHFKYKIQRDNIGDAYRTARFSKRLAIMGAIISVVSILLSVWGAFSG